MAANTEQFIANNEEENVEEHFQGYDAVFVPDIDKKYSCPVCLAALRDTVQTRCGHRFCQTCLTRVCRNRKYVKCPVDNTWFDSDIDVFDDVAMRREVLSLMVLCRYYGDGCDWKGELRELEEHCPICPFEQLTCPNICGDMFLRKFREKHLKECPRRPIHCKHCSENMIFKDLTRHELLVCPRFPVSCALCGQGGILRDDIPKHIDTQDGSCPNSVVPCTFEHIGCHAQVKRCELGNHCEEATTLHLSLLSSLVCQQQLQLQNTQVELLETREKYMTLSGEHSQLTLKLKEKELMINCQEERISFLENTSFNGKLLWKMKLADKDEQCCLTSPTFYTGCPGYRVCIQVELNAYNGRDETYTSLFVILQKGTYDDAVKFPFNAVCKLTVYDQDSLSANREDFTTTIVCSEVPRSPDNGYNENQKRGLLKFMMTEKLIGAKYAKDGNVYFQIEVNHTAPVDIIMST
ncbi:TNF receptor-associated factor 6-like [Glandiceps talaboti]